MNAKPIDGDKAMEYAQLSIEVHAKEAMTAAGNLGNLRLFLALTTIANDDPRFWEFVALKEALVVEQANLAAIADRLKSLAGTL